MSVRKSGVSQLGEVRRGVVGITLVTSRHSRRAAGSTRLGTGAWIDARCCILAGRWVLPAVRRAKGERRADAPAPRQGPARHTLGRLEVLASPTSRSATFTARPRASLARPEGAERPEDPQGCCAEHVWDDGTSRRGGSFSLIPRCAVCFLGKQRAQGAQRPEARGIPARRVETAQRARQGSPVAKRRAQSLCCIGDLSQSNRACSHHAHNGWERTRSSASSRMRVRSCTRAGPRGSSSRCTT